MSLRDGEFELDESDYAVDVGDASTCYTSMKSGIVVEVKGNSIIIQSNGEVPRKKSRRGTK